MAVEVVKLVPFRGIGNIVAYGVYHRFFRWNDGTTQRTGLGWIDFSLPFGRVAFGGWWFDSNRVLEPYGTSNLLCAKLDMVWQMLDRLGLPRPAHVVADPLEEGYAASCEEALTILAAHIAAETREEAARIVGELCDRAEREP